MYHLLPNEFLLAPASKWPLRSPSVLDTDQPNFCKCFQANIFQSPPLFSVNSPRTIFSNPPSSLRLWSYYSGPQKCMHDAKALTKSRLRTVLSQGNYRFSLSPPHTVGQLMVFNLVCFTDTAPTRPYGRKR